MIGPETSAGSPENPSGDPYRALALDSPTDVMLGGALITMVEPDAGHETAYNRWYEDDHFYAGATAGPWAFAARRWVAPRQLQELRLPSKSPLADPITQGCYISTYWITAGHLEDFRSWAIPLLFEELIPAHRGFYDRTHVYTSFHDHAFDVMCDPPPMQSIHALDHPYEGLVVEVIQAASPETRPDLVSWLEREFVPAFADAVPRSGQCIGFVTTPNAPETVAHISDDPVDMQTCICLLWFMTQRPAGDWPGHFAGHEQALEAAGGKLLLIAPFVPTIPGTNEYIDQLR